MNLVEQDSDSDVQSVIDAYRTTRPNPEIDELRMRIAADVIQVSHDIRMGTLSHESSDSKTSDDDTSSVPETVTKFLAARLAYLDACSNIQDELNDANIAVGPLEVTQQDIDAKIANIDSQWQAKPEAWTIAEDGKLDLSDDPMVSVEINNRHRRADVPDGPGSDLYTVNQWHAAGPRIYKFNAPTFAPQRWGVSHTIDQVAYKNNFFQEFPEMSRILPMANVAVCGGAAAFPLGDSARKPSDVDFFLYGLPTGDDEASRRVRWGCVNALVNRIRNEFESCIEMICSGVITIKCIRKYDRGIVASDQSQPVKCQIILRAYPTVSSILHGFDVPSCCVAYDGHVAVMTQLAAFAHMFRTNIVVPEYRSTTYESRLLKYFERGFALVMPYLDIKALTVGSVTTLLWLMMTPTLIKGRFIAGSLALREKQPCSDYTPVEPKEYRHYSRWREHGIARNGQQSINLKMLASDRSFVKIASMQEVRVTHRRRMSESDDIGLPFETFWTEPTKSDIFPRAELEKTLKKTVKAAVSKTGMVNTMALRYIFLLQPEQILKLVQAVSEIREASSSASRIDISASLEPFCNALLARWDARPDTIDWWILADPGRQYTSSLNPRCEDPRTWYGGTAFADVMPPPGADETLETMIGVYEQRSVVRSNGGIFDGTCYICHEDIHAGDKNSVTLQCGHVFHVTSTESCGGLCIWAIDGNRTCPTCRANFGVAHVENTRATPIAISIQL